MGFYCNLRHFVTKSGIHTVLLRNFCHNLCVLWGEKLSPKAHLWRKMTNMRSVPHLLTYTLQRGEIGKGLVGPGALPRDNQLFIDWVLGRQPFIVYRHDLHDMLSWLYVLTEAEGFPFSIFIYKGGGLTNDFDFKCWSGRVSFLQRGHSRNRLTGTPEAGIKAIFFGKNLVSSSGKWEQIKAK